MPVAPCGPGSAPTTAPSNSRATACACWSVACRSRVPGSTPSSPSGCIASAPLSSQRACSVPRRWPTEFAPITAVPTSPTLRFQIRFSKRPVDHALGALVFSVVEIWASLSERSANLRPTPADQAVLGLVGWQHAPVSPTVVVVACLLPFASFYYGFSQYHQRETDDDRDDKPAQDE